MTDSLPDREQQIPFGMLAKHDLAYLIQKKEILQNSIYVNLKAAVYEMRLGSFAFRWEGDKRKIIRLGDQHDRELILPPNSLTFVTTVEKFNLPTDIIARFNLKVDWVHCGLLLGTGPIVNPGFNGYLLIPIHNFSSREVQICYGAKLIAVEFTKIPSVEGEEFSFEQKVLNDDVENLVKPFSEAAKYVESSILKVLREYNEKLESNTTEITASKVEREKWNRRFTWGGLASAFVGGIALASLVFTTWSVHLDTRQKILAAHEALLTVSDRIEKENVRMRTYLKTLAEQVRVLSSSAEITLPEDNAQNSQGQPDENTLDSAQQKALRPLPLGENALKRPK